MNFDIVIANKICNFINDPNSLFAFSVTNSVFLKAFEKNFRKKSKQFNIKYPYKVPMICCYYIKMNNFGKVMDKKHYRKWINSIDKDW